MTNLQLEISTHEKRLVYDLMGKTQVKTDEATGAAYTVSGPGFSDAYGSE